MSAKDVHTHDDGGVCCECGDSRHCCCDCPAFAGTDAQRIPSFATIDPDALKGRPWSVVYPYPDREPEDE